MRRRLALPLILVATLARADVPPRHVYVSGLDEGDVSLVVSSTTGDPVGVVAGGEIVPPPTGGARREDEALLGPLPDPGSSSAPPMEMRPDRMTGTVTATDYFEAFTPAVAPYKRSVAYDAVRVDADGTPVLHVADETPQAVAILGTSPPNDGPRDAFWGTAMLDFRRGSRVAIPSVAPSARILHARTEPAIDFVLETDSAGNSFAHAIEPGAGVVRLTFLTDAPRGFFRRAPPTQRVDALASHLPSVPDSVRQRALRFAAELGVTPGTPVDRALDVLVGHFRAFVEADEMPSPSGDVYLDLARGGVGVCRHRAYAFVVTALGLGLPAHYVQNEAHAWVEVELRDGWLRIDLGGSAQGVNAHGLQDRPKHEIAAADPFPQPEVFVRDYLERGVAPEPQPTASGSGASQGGSSSGGATNEAAGGQDEGSTHSDNAAPLDPGTSPAQEPDLARPDPEAPADARVGTRLALDADEHRVYRGQMLDLAGRLVDDAGAVIADGRVEIRVGGGRLLGVALTDEDGRFAVSLGIPPDLDVGRHPMQVEYVGDASRRPSRAP